MLRKFIFLFNFISQLLSGWWGSGAKMLLKSANRQTRIKLSALKAASDWSNYYNDVTWNAIQILLSSFLL